MTKLQKLLEKSASSPGFLKFWSQTTGYFGSRGSKYLAFQEWNRLDLEGCEDELIAIYQKQVQAKKNAHSAGDFTPMFPHICRWLKHRRWEDETGEDSPAPKEITREEATRAFEMLEGGKDG